MACIPFICFFLPKHKTPEFVGFVLQPRHSKFCSSGCDGRGIPPERAVPPAAPRCWVPCGSCLQHCLILEHNCGISAQWGSWNKLEQGPPVPSASPRVPLKCHPVNVTAAVSNGDTNWALLKLSCTRASHQAAVQGWQRLNSSASSPRVISTEEIQTSNPCNLTRCLSWCPGFGVRGKVLKITELLMLGLMLSWIFPAQVEGALKALQLHTGGWISVFSAAWCVLLCISQILIKFLAHSCVAMGLCRKPGVPLPWVSFSGQKPFHVPTAWLSSVERGNLGRAVYLSQNPLHFCIKTLKSGCGARNLLLANPPGRGCKVVTRVGPSFSLLWKADSDLCVSKNDLAIIY